MGSKQRRGLHLHQRGAAAWFLAFGCLITALPLGATMSPSEDGRPASPLIERWDAIEARIADDRFSLALDEIAPLLAAARSAGDEDLWARALARGAQLESRVHGAKAAVALLREQPWPTGPAYRSILSAFYANALGAYGLRLGMSQGGGPPIEAEPGQALPLELWSRDKAGEEARAACVAALAGREALARLPAERWSFWIDWDKTRDETRPETGGPPSSTGRTLRDAIVYSCVDLFENRTLWPWAQLDADPESAGIDMAELAIREAEPLPATGIDPTLHPLAALAAMLGDLEAWHAAEGRREEALEALLARIRHFAPGADFQERVRIEGDLTHRLDRFRDLPGWADGQAVRAQLLLQGDARGRNVEAHAASVAGRDAWPESHGGTLCARLVREIEAPSSRITVRSGDGLGRASIRVAHRNLPALYFRAYPLDLVARLERWKSPAGFDDDEIALLLATGTPIAAWKSDLPPTPDFADRETSLVPPLDRPGAYLLLASRGADFATPTRDLTAVTFLLGDLTLVPQPMRDGGLEVMALSGASGEPLAGARVKVWRQDDSGPQESREGRVRHAAEATTGADGTASFPPQPGWIAGITAERLGEVAHLDAHDLPSWGYEMSADDAGLRLLLYTDRSIYRPGQTIHWKVLGYSRQEWEGGVESAKGERFVLRLLTPGGEEAARREITTNDFGTAAGDFALSSSARLGSWSLEGTPLSGSQEPSAGRDKISSASIRVEEYKRPSFEVSLEPPAEPLLLGRPVKIRGLARYYFGSPVGAGEVRWSIYRSPLWSSDWEGSSGLRTRKVASGLVRLKTDGSFDLDLDPQPPKADHRAGAPSDEGIYAFRIEAEVTADGGETREGRSILAIGRSDRIATLRLGHGFFPLRRPIVVTAGLSDLAGRPQAGSGEWTLHSLVQPAEPPPSEDDSGLLYDFYAAEPERPREEILSEVVEALGLQRERRDADEQAMATWPPGRQLGEGAVRHGAGGEAEIALPPLPAGAYRLTYTTRDSAGAEIEVQRSFWVAGGRAKGGLPPLTALPALLRAERATVRVGGTARILAGAPFRGQRLFFEVWHADQRIERRSLRGGRYPSWIAIPVPEALRGGFAVRLYYLREHRLYERSLQIDVPWERELELRFSTFRDRLRPGGRESWRVTVRPGNGRSAELGGAEVLARMVDRSLDLFGIQDPPDPRRLYRHLWECPSAVASFGWGTPHWFRRLDEVPGLPVRLPARFLPLDPFDRRENLTELGELLFHDDWAEQSITVTAGTPWMDSRRISTGATVSMAALSKPMPKIPPGLAARRGGGEGRKNTPSLRSNFSEVAFWQPQLLTDPDGAVAIEFTVPDSATSWNVFVQAITRDLRSASMVRTARSERALFARPYLPRFFRAGDQVEIPVVLTSGVSRALSGEVTLRLFDPETGDDRLADFGLEPAETRLPFHLQAKGGTTVTFPLRVPARAVGKDERSLGTVAFEVSAQAGDESDGESRPLPILPARFDLIRSRTALLRTPGAHTFDFDPPANAGPDPTQIQERLVVTVEGELFDGMLAALPYLVDFPHECSEQTLNRFVSTALLSHLFERHPGLAAMAQREGRRETQNEGWDDADPNRAMALDETPFLCAARGGGRLDTLRVLDPEVARANQESALGRLERMQLPSGAFPWWPEGPPSDPLTVYVLTGLARASSYGVKVDPGMWLRGWRYLEMRYRASDEDRGPRPHPGHGSFDLDLLVRIGHALTLGPQAPIGATAFSPAERQEVLERTFGAWRTLPLSLRSLLALTLERSGRHDDALLVFESVLDRARTTEDEGTFWEPCERPWLREQDRVESHTLALRALLEILPDDPRRHGLVQWLLLHRQLNHWGSTRATAEALDALAAYLEREGQMEVPQAVTVKVGEKSERFDFAPGADGRRSERRRTWIVAGPELGAAAPKVEIEKKDDGFLYVAATLQISTERIPAQGEGDLFTLERRYFKVVHGAGGETLRPLGAGAELQPGDEVEIRLTLGARQEAEYVQLRDPRPAGFEPETTQSGWSWEGGAMAYVETRDSGTNTYFERLTPGTRSLRYRLRATLAGTFRTAPAIVQSLYSPEFAAYSPGATLRVDSR